MKDRKNQKSRRICLVLAGALIALLIAPAMAFAADTITLSHIAGFSATQGDSNIYIVVRANVVAGESDYTLTLTSQDSDITVTTGNTGIFPAGTDNEGTFIVKVSKTADVGNHKLTVKAIAADTQVVIEAETLTIRCGQKPGQLLFFGAGVFRCGLHRIGGKQHCGGAKQHAEPLPV
jgi:hypothetical protein